MRDNHCYSMLSFWYERQQAGHSPVFRFQQYCGTEELFAAQSRQVQPQSDDKGAEERNEELDIGAESLDKPFAKPDGGQNGAGGKPRKKQEKNAGKGKQRYTGKGKQKADEDLADSSSESSSSEDSLSESGSGSESEEMSDVEVMDWGTLYDKDKEAAEKAGKRTEHGGEIVAGPSQSKLPHQYSLRSEMLTGTIDSVSMTNRLHSEETPEQDNKETEMPLTRYPSQDHPVSNPAHPPDFTSLQKLLADPGLLSALQALQVQSQPPSPDKQMTSPQHLPASPTKKSPTSTQPSIPKMELVTPGATPELEKAESNPRKRSGMTRGGGGRGQGLANTQTDRMTRSSSKATHRTTRSKV
jgi:hypothetical protein